MGVIYQIVIAGGSRSYIGSTRRFGYRKSHHLFLLRDQHKGRLYNASLMAAAPLGLKKTSEQIEKSARFHRGRTRSHETRTRMSASMMGNTNGRHTRRDFCKRNHPLTADNLYTRARKGRIDRACRICALERAKGR